MSVNSIDREDYLEAFPQEAKKIYKYCLEQITPDKLLSKIPKEKVPFLTNVAYSLSRDVATFSGQAYYCLSYIVEKHRYQSKAYTDLSKIREYYFELKRAISLILEYSMISSDRACFITKSIDDIVQKMR